MMLFHKHRDNPGIVLCLITLIALFSCKDEEVQPPYQARPGDLIGNWIVDQDAMKTKAGWSITDRATIALLHKTKVQFTPNSIKVRLELLGESKEISAAYKIAQIQHNQIKLQAKESLQASDSWIVEFFNQDQMIFRGRLDKPGEKPQDKSSLELIMKRDPAAK